MKSPFFVLSAALLLTASTALAAPPANDNFADATVLTGNSGSTTGTNVEATLEVDEPDHLSGTQDASVWFSFSPPTAGSFVFDTFGSDFDTVLSVFTGSDLTTLTRLTTNDQSGGDQSKVTFSGTPGTTYYIAVTGYDVDVVGSITLNWAPYIAPVGQITIYKVAGSYDGSDQSVMEDTPPVPDSFKYTGKYSNYEIYDHVNKRSTSISFYTSKVEVLDGDGIPTGKFVSKKYYSSSGFAYADGNFSYDIIPLRLPGTFQWISLPGYGNGYNDSDLGEGNVWGTAGCAKGAAASVVLSPTLSITVPRIITEETLDNSHRLEAGYTDESGDFIEVPIRSFSTSTYKSTQTLDLPLTKAANLADLIFESQSHAKGTLENGYYQVIKALKAQGYEEDPGYGYY